MNKKNCCICNEILMNEMDSSLQSLSGLQNRKLIETNNFILFPSISPISEGHYLIFPKSHVTSFSQIHKNTINELKILINNVFIKLKKFYNDIMIFEHGVGNDKIGGCGIDHAHIHLLPSSQKEIEYVVRTISINYQHNRNLIFEQLFRTNKNQTYILVGTEISSYKIFLSDHFKSQTIRKLICNYRNKKNCDWKQLTDWNNFILNHKLAKTFF